MGQNVLLGKGYKLALVSRNGFLGTQDEALGQNVVWHDSLTQEQTNAIKRLQIVAIKIILGADCPGKPDGHFDYP